MYAVSNWTRTLHHPRSNHETTTTKKAIFVLYFTIYDRYAILGSEIYLNYGLTYHVY